jgi:hypothetical protein
MNRGDKIPLDDFLDWATRGDNVELFDIDNLAASLLGTGCSLEVDMLDDETLSGPQYKNIGGLSEIFSADVRDGNGKLMGYLGKVYPSIDVKYLRESGEKHQAPLPDRIFTHEVAYAFTSYRPIC